MVRIHLNNRKRRSTSKRPTRGTAHSVRLTIEQLEDRRVMAGFIQGFAFIDAGVPNNHFDAGELPKVGATIELRSADGSALLQSVMTGADGYYRFDGLATGTYQVKEIPTSGYANQGVEFSTVLSSASPLGAGTILVNLVDPDSAPSVTINRQPELPGASVSFTLVGGPFNSFTQPDNHVQQFQININGGSDFYSFCTDLFHGFPDGNAVSFTAQPGTLPVPPGLAANIGRIGYLYNTFGTDLLASPTDRAGLQIAIWELIYDASPDLTTGAFTVGPGPSNPAALAAANSYLAISAGHDQRAIFLNDLAPPYPDPAGRGNQGMLATENFNFANVPGIIVTPDKSNRSLPFVHIVNPTTGELISSFLAYDINYRGGVRVATGDITGDGIPEIITAPGRNAKPIVKVFSLNGTLLEEFLAFPATFKGGVDLAIGDINNDGQNDIVAAMSFGGNQVKAFTNPNGVLTTVPTPFHAAYNFGTTTTVAKSLVAFTPFGTFKGGASVAVADMGTVVNGGKTKTLNTTLDGRPEIIVANEAGMRSTVYVYGFLPVLSAASTSGTAYRLRSYLPFASTYRGGLSLSVAPVAHTGQDLIPDIIVGAASLGTSQVQILNGATTSTVVVGGFVAFSSADTPSYNSPVHVTAIDEDRNGIAESILASQGCDGAFRRIRKFDTLTGTLVGELLEADFDPSAVDHFFGAYFTASLKR